MSVGFTERRWKVREDNGLLWKQIREGFFISPDNGTSWSDARPEITLHSFADVSRYEETFDHLPSLPEKGTHTIVDTVHVANQCPMDVCLAPLEAINFCPECGSYDLVPMNRPTEPGHCYCSNCSQELFKRVNYDDAIAENLKRRHLLEEFYKEVQRILSDVDGSTRVQAQLSNALRKVEQA